MLVLKDLGKALACYFFDVVVAFEYEIEEHGNQVRVDFRHVEQMDRLQEVSDELEMLPP